MMMDRPNRLAVNGAAIPNYSRRIYYPLRGIMLEVEKKKKKKKKKKKEKKKKGKKKKK